MPTELHLALQRHYAGDDGLLEASVGGYRVDVLRGGVVYEIQTGSFVPLRDKLAALAALGPVVLVYPVAQTRRLVRVDPATGEELSARRSPQHGSSAQLFDQLLYLRRALLGGNLAVEVVLTSERELRCADGRGSWRRHGVSLAGRELVEVLGVERFESPADLARLLPSELPEPFTVAELAQAGRLTGRIAGRMAFALRELGVLEQVGKRGNAFLYRRVAPPAPRGGRSRGHRERKKSHGLD